MPNIDLEFDKKGRAFGSKVRQDKKKSDVLGSNLPGFFEKKAAALPRQLKRRAEIESWHTLSEAYMKKHWTVTNKE